MATASKKPSLSPSNLSQNRKRRTADATEPGALVRAFEGVYRFLASLKLAVISLSLLSLVLTIGMIFEKNFGNPALQRYFYRTWWFGLLLAMLGINILCAATIRFPWKRRQTGFVVTHAGLIILLVGSWISLQTGDEGQLAMVEGDTSDAMARMDDYMLRVQPIDARTGQPEGNSYAFPLFPGPRPWKSRRTETLTRPNDPFELEVTGFLPASIGKRFADPVTVGGVPMMKLTASLTPPMALTPIDALDDPSVIDGRRWIAAGDMFKRKVLSLSPARFVLQYVEPGARAREAVEDFLELPEKGTVEVARLRFEDASGRTRMASYRPTTETWTLPDGTEVEGRSVALPDSDLTATFERSGPLSDPSIFSRLETVRFDIGTGAEDVEEEDHTGHDHPPGEHDPHGGITLLSLVSAMIQNSDDRDLSLAEFSVRRGNGPAVAHWAVPIPPAALPPMSFAPSGGGLYAPTPGLIRLSYYRPLDFAKGMDGLKGSFEVLAMGNDRLYYRAINAEGVQNSGDLEIGEDVAAFGGANRAMQATFKVDDFYSSALPSFTYVERVMPPGQAGQGVPAAQIKFTDGGRTDERWVLLSTTPTLEPNPRAVETIPLGPDRYKVSFDIDRGSLPFRLRLVDFRRRFDKGTAQPSHYESDVLLYDDEEGIDGRKVTISMNEPLSHRGYTFYQSSFTSPTDTAGRFISVFQVRYDPTWQVIYFGCLMVVIGTLLQFVMRAGVFSDGGKSERAKAGGPRPDAEPATVELL